MDVLNAGNDFGGGQQQLFNGKWAAVLAFKQTSRQKNDKGIIVACPKAARRFALILLSYADEEEGSTSRIVTTMTMTKKALQKALTKKKTKKKVVKRKKA